MLDVKILSELVEKEVSATVERYVSTILSDSQWQLDLETKITKFVQDRILAKFSNVGSVPGLVDTVKQGVNDLFSNGQVPGIDQYVDNTVIVQAVDSAIQKLIKDTIQNLTIDKSWTDKIEKIVNQEMSQRLLVKLSDIDINSIIVQEIDRGIDKWQDKLITEFKTPGIIDTASECELTIVDGAVVVSNGLSSKTALFEQDIEVKGTAIVDNLIVKKIVNTDSPVWNELSNTIAIKTKNSLTDEWTNSLVNKVLDTAKQDGIEFKNIILNGELVIDGERLNTKITESNIEQLGNLKSLNVNGNASINDTFSVRKNRVGINTDKPDMALTVWDEEISVIVGKVEKNKAFIGTNQKQTLSLGVNRQGFIEIGEDGLTTIKQLRIDRFKISHNHTVPGWSGSKGDIVFNNDYKAESAFAWVCLGGFRWQPLKSAS